MIMTIHHQAHTRHIAVHHIIQVAVMEAAVIHQRAILPVNTIVVMSLLLKISIEISPVLRELITVIFCY